MLWTVKSDDDRAMERTTELPDLEVDDTVKIFRPPPRVYTDPLGQNVWMGEVEPLELELEDSVGTDPYDSAHFEDPWSRTRA